MSTVKEVIKIEDVKTITIQAHCSDSFNLLMYGENNKRIGSEYSGYVPLFLGGSDDVNIEIDVKTGQILNWKFVQADIDDMLVRDKEASPTCDGNGKQ